MKRAWIAFVITLVLVLPIRIISIVRYLDPQTGFYSDGSVTVGVASILLLAGILATVYFARKDRTEALAAKPVKNIYVAVLGAVAGIFLLVQSVLGLGADLFVDGQIFYRIFSVLGILAGMILLAEAYDFATGLRTVASRPLLALIPSLWGCFFLVVLFIAYSAVVNLVEDVYHTFTVVFLLLFLFTQAKLLTGIESSKSRKLIYMVGFPAALFAFTTGIPSCIQYFSTGEMSGVITIGQHMTNIVLGFYIVAFLFALRKTGAEEEVTVQPEPTKDPVNVQQEAEQPAEPENKQKDSLSVYVDFLSEAYGSGEKFVAIGESPFYFPENNVSEES